MLHMQTVPFLCKLSFLGLIISACAINWLEITLLQFV